MAVARKFDGNGGMVEDGFTDEQQQYLSGLAHGIEVARVAQGLPPLFAGRGTGPSTPTGPDAPALMAQDRVLASGKKLVNEEQAKRDKPPLDIWNDIAAHADRREFPKGLDVFLFKYHGLFYVSPAQNAFMCRLRIPGGILNAYQFRGCADLAERHGAGHADVTTRANLQIREIGAEHSTRLLTGLADLGLTSRGSGADNIRNVTGSPTAGIDRQEIIDTRPYAYQWHHYILNNRDLYGLPRKFNVAFDGGGTLAVLEDTNDIGWSATRVLAGGTVPEGIYFRLSLGGITGHRDFARDTGVLVPPDAVNAVTAALVRVYLANGDRTDRKKARLKYLLDDWGFDKYLAATEELLGSALARVPMEHCAPRGPLLKHGHVGVHPQRQPGLFYAGIVLPVGRMTSGQMRGLADLSTRYGGGTIRLTVWQNLLISDIKEAELPKFEQDLAAIGLGCQASSIRGALIACTGNKGCRFANADTKGHALQLADYLEQRVTIDTPLNIHLTGCPHSCAQHYIGDIGLLAAKVVVGEDDAAVEVEGYSVCVGGGFGEDRAIARELFAALPYDDIPPRLARLLDAYKAERSGDESFAAFTRRHDIDTLVAFANPA